MTTQNVTNKQIEQLEVEAGSAGDSETVEFCRRALDGDKAAREECTKVILEAQAMANDRS